MATKNAPARSEFIDAAIRFVDDNGLTALTLRSIGDALGVNHTALYRHFRDKDELILAMLDEILIEVTDAPLLADAPPREQLLHLLRLTRQVLNRHPDLAGALISTPGNLARGHRFTSLVVDQLGAMGLQGADVPQCYQVIEDFVIGATVYDLAGSPRHLETRRVRHRLFGHPLFDEISRTEADIAAHNEASFERGITLIVSGCESLVTDPAPRNTGR